MSFYTQFDNQAGADVATNQGWRDLCDWVAELTGADELRHLTEYGWSEHLDDISSELEAAISDGEPSPDVKSTAQGLLDQIDANGGADILVVTDGAGAEEDEPDEPDEGDQPNEIENSNGRTTTQEWIDRTFKTAQKTMQPIHVTVNNAPQEPPHVTVNNLPPDVRCEPQITVNTPKSEVIVNVPKHSAPVIKNVVNVPAPEVTVHVPPAAKEADSKIEIQRDSDGKIVSATKRVK